MHRAALWVCASLSLFCLTSPRALAEIEFWHIETDVRANTIRYLAQAFEAETGLGPISVKRINEDEFRKRFEEAANHGQPPAMALADLEQIASVDFAHGLDHRAATKVIERTGVNRFAPQALLNVRDGSAEQSYFAVPLYAWVMGLWYRKDWFDREGLQPPETWEAIEAAARHFHNPDQGRFGLILGTDADVYAEQVFSHLALSNGAELVADNGAVRLSSPAMKEAAEFYRRLARYTPSARTRWQDYPLYVQDRVAMLFFSSYLMEDLFTRIEAELAAGNAVDPALPNKTGVVTAIHQLRPARFGALRVLALSRQVNARDQETMESFAEFLLRRDAYIAFLHCAPGGMLPILRGVGDSETFLNDPQGVFRRFQRSTLRSLDLEGKFIETFSIRPDGFSSPAAAIVGARLLPPVLEKVLNGRPVDDVLISTEQAARTLLEQ